MKHKVSFTVESGRLGTVLDVLQGTVLDIVVTDAVQPTKKGSANISDNIREAARAVQLAMVPGQEYGHKDPLLAQAIAPLEFKATSISSILSYANRRGLVERVRRGVYRRAG